MTGEDVLEALSEEGIDFVGELHPYDRKCLEYKLDELIDAAIEAAVNEAMETDDDEA